MQAGEQYGFFLCKKGTLRFASQPFAKCPQLILKKSKMGTNTIYSDTALNCLNCLGYDRSLKL